MSKISLFIRQCVVGVVLASRLEPQLNASVCLHWCLSRGTLVCSWLWFVIVNTGICWRRWNVKICRNDFNSSWYLTIFFHLSFEFWKLSVLIYFTHKLWNFPIWIWLPNLLLGILTDRLASTFIFIICCYSRNININ